MGVNSQGAGCKLELLVGFHCVTGIEGYFAKTPACAVYFLGPRRDRIYLLLYVL